MIKVKVRNAKELVALFRRAPKIAKKIIKKAVSDSAYLVQNKSAREAPFDTGNLKKSIETDLSNLENFRAEIEPKIEYAELVHEGRKAITAKSKKVLAARADRVSPRTRKKFANRIHKSKKDGQRWIIFGKRVRATKPNPFMYRGKVQSGPRVKKIFENARAKIIKKLTLKI